MYEIITKARRWSRTTIEKRPRLEGSADSKSAHLSYNKLSGHFDPGGNKDFSGAGAVSAGCGCLFLDEFPELPDFTIPFRGGIDRRGPG